MLRLVHGLLPRNLSIFVGASIARPLFQLKTDPYKKEITMLMRLDKYLCSCGTGTRTEVKKIIKSKRVKVNNKIIDTSDFR